MATTHPTTTVEFRIPTAETALEQVFAAEPTLYCEMEQAVGPGFPNLWFTGVTSSDLETAFDATPVVGPYSRIAAYDDRVLYDLPELAALRQAFDIVIDAGGTVRNLAAGGDVWTLTVRFTGRDSASRVYDRFEECPLTVTVGRLCEGDTASARKGGLTRDQHETLQTAVEHGYFDIPRGITMEELADELGVSHQAVSERLRRAYRTIVVDELDIDSERGALTESSPVP